MKSTNAEIYVALIALSFSGCTALSLERHTANQAMTAAEMRYQLVLVTLAKVSANPGNLPSLGTVTDGQATVTDSASVDLKTAIDGLKGFTQESITGTASRSPNLQWTIDTANTPEQIKAVRIACNWVLTGVEPHDENDKRLLRLFQVYDDLACLNSNHAVWFCTGCKRDVPRNCCCIAQYCGSYFWVNAEGLAGLTEFTLILADIATVQPASLRGNALVTVTQSVDGAAATALTVQSVPFEYDASIPSMIDFLAPVVVYGATDSKNFKTKWPTEPGWCGAKDSMDRRHLMPSGQNASNTFRQQQQQFQNQAQMYLNSK